MANTLKFGNGEWYGKKDTILAYNDENNNYKPLPFDFSRGSSATVVNKDGLIETVGSGEPRIDYKDNTKGALLLEPSRSNLVTYSEGFENSAWNKFRLSVSTDSIISPDGNSNTYEITEDDTNTTHVLRQYFTSLNTDYSFSFFVKSKSGDRYVELNLGRNSRKSIFDIENGIIISDTTNNAKITSLDNDWYKISISDTVLLSENSYDIRLVDKSSGSDTYLGNGTSGVYIYAAQLEQGSYPTSYIPTSGGVVTRLADSCSQTVPDGVIGQTEGTMYAEYYFDATIDNAGGSDRDIVSINDGTFNNIIQLVHYGNGVGSAYKSVYLNARLSSSYVVSIASSAYDSGLMKVAGAYKNNDYVLYVNGVQIGTDTNASVPSCSVINFAKITGTETPTPINDLKLYNTRLTNSELQALTTI